MCYDYRPTLSGPKCVPPFVQVLRWSCRILSGSPFHVPRFSFGTVAAVIASGDAVAVARAESYLCPSFYNGVLQRRVPFLNFRMSLPSGVWSLPGLQPKLLEPRWGFNSCRNAFISTYCVVVVVTSCSRTALSLVAAEAMLSMSPLKESMNSSAGIAPGGGNWA